MISSLNSGNISSFSPSLESELKNEWMVDIDLDYTSDFDKKLTTREEYFEPNEEHPEAVIPHLALAEKNIIVSTGTERSLFDLLFGEFEGLVIRDVNPLTAAYHHFNIILLRFCSREEYNTLSTPVFDGSAATFIPTKVKANHLIKQAPFLERMAIISKKIENSDLADELKEFYQRNLNVCGAVYLSQDHNWRRWKSFSACQYQNNESQFLKLQKLARKGMIVPTTGDINQLQFLDPKKVPFKISVVDTSNIADYVPIDLQGLSGTSTRIITTTFSGANGVYFSCMHRPFSEQEASEFNHLFRNVLLPCHESEAKAEKTVKSLKKINMRDVFNITTPNIYSSDRLGLLQEYLDESVINIPGIQVDMKSNMKKLNTLSPTDIQKLCEHPRTAQFLKILVSTSQLSQDIYMAFSKIKGWTETFESYFMENPSKLPRLLKKLRNASLLTVLIENLGREKINGLIAAGLKDEGFEKEWSSRFNTSPHEGIFSILQVDKF